LKISESELAVAREKVLRADKHLQVAHRMMRRFARNDCGVYAKFNTKTKQFDVIAKLPEPPTIIGLLVGDCIHNLRSALDHVVYALISTNPAGAGNPPSERAMFPICDTRAGYVHQVKKLHRLDGLPEAVAALIESLQPYRTREKGLDYTMHPLWVLNKLQNIDKHRRLMLAAGVARLAHVSVRYKSGHDMDLVIAEDMLYDGAILTSYPPAPDGSEVQMNGYLVSYVAMREVDELRSLVDEDIYRILLQLVDYVGNVLMPSFGKLATFHKPPRKRRRPQDRRWKLPKSARGL
jgi:hypothetical protein